MRVIAGSAKRVQLQTPEGLKTRPTTDRIKETIFNMLQPYLADCNFLDLFSGSGAIGIEALSRGAEYAAFIEKDKEALQCIKKNLSTTKLEAKADILFMDILQGLKTLEKKEVVFDIIFMDPPYNQGFEIQVLEYLKASKLLNDDTIVIFEASLETETDKIEKLGFTIEKIKKYKTNMHVFVSKNTDV